MMNMENICQGLGKNSNKMAKGPFNSAVFEGNGEFGKKSTSRSYKSNEMTKWSPLKVAILTKMAYLAKIAKIDKP